MSPYPHHESSLVVVENSVIVAPETGTSFSFLTVPEIVEEPDGAATIVTVSSGPSAETDKLFLIARKPSLLYLIS